MPRLVRFLVSFFLLDIFTMCADSSDLPTCPIWTYPSTSGNECVCGDNLENVITYTCNQKSLTVQLNRRFYCFMLLNDNGVNTTLLGTCPYGDSVRLSIGTLACLIYIYEDSRLCLFYNQTGQLCGECMCRKLHPPCLFILPWLCRMQKLQQRMD